MGRHAKHHNTSHPHLPNWIKVAAPYMWRLALAVAHAVAAAIVK